MKNQKKQIPEALRKVLSKAGKKGWQKKLEKYGKVKVEIKLTNLN